MAVDHPVVAVAHRAGAERRRVGARHLGLGHREERPDPAGDEREKPALLLLVGAEEVQDLGVAGVRRLAAEDELAPHGEADLLVQVRVVEEAGPGAARLGRDVRCPESEPAHLVAERRDERVRFVVLPVEDVLVREHAIGHERAHLREPFSRRGEGRRGHCIASHLMKLGFYMGYAQPGTSPLELLELAREAETLGYDSAWAAEAWGVDAITPLAWLGAQTVDVEARHGDHAAARAARRRTPP